MPNTTVLAAARTMLETTNRRTVLGALVSVPALALPVGSMSAATSAALEAAAHPDADLFALAERCEAAAKRADVAADAYGVAEFASPHNEAEEAEALRLQDISLDELNDLATQVVGREP
jgi:hypothetical protein